VFITTKVPGCDGFDFLDATRDNCYNDTIRNHQRNLDELQMNYVDLLLVHYPPNGGCSQENCEIVRENWSAI